MYEIFVPVVITFQLEDTYVTIRINFMRKDDKPYLMIQVEPLWS